MGVELTLDDFDRFSVDIPLLANLQPSGQYFMEDFYYAGGVPVIMQALGRRLHDCLTVNGSTVHENAKTACCYNENVISGMRSEEHTSELQSLMRISYAVFC